MEQNYSLLNFEFNKKNNFWDWKFETKETKSFGFYQKHKNQKSESEIRHIS